MEANDNKSKTTNTNNNTTMTIIEEKHCPPSDSIKEQPIQEINYDIHKPWEKASKKHQQQQGGGGGLSNKGSELFVGNLSIETTEEDLYTTFQPYGEIIDIRIHKNNQTKKCYAFIRFSSKEMTQKAFELNLTMLKGRRIKITKSNENSTIFIGNIRKTWTNSEVEAKFHNVGRIEHFPDIKNSNKNRGFCFAIFNNRNEAIKALNYVASKGGINIDGIPLTCDWADVVDDEESNSKQIFLSGLNECIEETVLRDLFKAYGKVTNVILSKNHLNSKRKDLAFITFESHSEALKAIELFNQETELKESLGNNVTASIAFSQQAMQAKKKIKDSRKKVSQILNNNNNNNAGTNNNTSANDNVNVNVGQDQILSNTDNNNNDNDTNQLLNQNINATAMLAMMNLINMNRTNPNMLSQVMTACLGSMLNTPQTEVQTQQGIVSGKHPTSYSSGSFSNPNNSNSNNPNVFLNNKRNRPFNQRMKKESNSSFNNPHLNLHSNPQSFDLNFNKHLPNDSFTSSPKDNQ